MQPPLPDPLTNRALFCCAQLDMEDEDVIDTMLEQVAIGHFGRYAHSPGTVFLTTPRSATLAEAQLLASKFGGRRGATLQSFPDRLILGAQARARLIAILECEHRARERGGRPPQADLKLVLSRGALLREVGARALHAMEQLYCAAAAGRFTFDLVKLRRVAAMPSGDCIAFHTDAFSELTMQVPLNDEAEYEGGRLLFATAEGMVQPRRAAGSATIHDNRIVHGVTHMRRGVRCGLFLLKTTEPASPRSNGGPAA